MRLFGPALAATWLVAGSSLAAEPVALRLTVCLAPPASRAVFEAQVLTSRMFEEVGVEVVWESRPGRCPEDGIHGLLLRRTPDALLPGAFGRAFPEDSTRFDVFYDRVQAAAPGPRLPSLLAHVLAHEITHVVQATRHHASEGLMKAHWVSHDVAGMAWRTMPFTTMDVALLHRGLDERAARLYARRNQDER